jgi:beta-barrel assembly-enhancing protease
MDNEKIFYCRNDGSAAEVRILLFNDTVNVYDAVTNNFVIAHPFKGISITKTGDDYFVYTGDASKEHLRIPAGHHQTDSILKEITRANQGFFKKLVRQRLVWFAAIIIGIIVGIYFLVITLVPYLGAAMISRDTEIGMGNQLKEVMLADEKVGGSTVDAARTVKLQAFADKIKLSDTYPIRVTIVNNATVNAYALPGGQIVVYSGMIENISSAEQLAALLAHEASHVDRRHSLRSMLRSTADALIISVIFSDVSAIAATIIGNTQALRSLDYSRSAEREADEFGMKLMLENDIDVSGMKKLMQVLQKQGDVPENISFLSSHPLTAKRIEAADDFIREHPQKIIVDNDLAVLFRQLKE